MELGFELIDLVFAVGRVATAQDCNVCAGLVGNPFFVPVRAHGEADGKISFTGERADKSRAFFALFEGHEIALGFAGLLVFAGRNKCNCVTIMRKENDVFGDGVGDGILVEVDRIKLAVGDSP